MKAIQMNHHREQNLGMLTDAEGAKCKVEGLLTILSEYLHPATVTHSHDI